MKKVFVLLACLISSQAYAGLIQFTGTLLGPDDYVLTAFTVESDQTVSAWTDSYNDGAGNFDPITALWNADGSYITHNDDNTSFSSEQQVFDSGISQFLVAGDYFFTVSVFSNFPNTSANILTNPEDVFSAGSGGTYGAWDYSQWLSGVASAEVLSDNVAVPEPSGLMVLLFSLISVVAVRRAKG